MGSGRQGAPVDDPEVIPVRSRRREFAILVWPQAGGGCLSQGRGGDVSMRHRSNCLVKMHRAFDVGDGSQGTVDVEYLMESCKRRAERRWQRTKLNDDRGERRSHLELVTGRSCCPPTGLSEEGSTIQVTWHLQPLPHTLINLGKQQMRGMLHVNHSLGGHGLRVRVVRFSLIQPSSPPIANFLHLTCTLSSQSVLNSGPILHVYCGLIFRSVSYKLLADIASHPSHVLSKTVHFATPDLSYFTPPRI